MKSAVLFLSALLLLAGCGVQAPPAEGRAEGQSPGVQGRALSDGALYKVGAVMENGGTACCSGSRIEPASPQGCIFSSVFYFS